MPATLHVLSIGSPESFDAVRHALFLRHNYRLRAATSCRDVCDLPGSGAFDVAVVHLTSTDHEPRLSLEYVRRHWPHTRILLVIAQPDGVDDPLYDEWARPGISGVTLLAIIERLAVDAKRKTRQLLGKWGLRHRSDKGSTS